MKIFAILWLLLISVLFFLPGSALPEQNLLRIPYLDKYVHFGFFAVLAFSWRFYFPPSPLFTGLLLLLLLIYGVGVEVVQHYLIANRSFDVKDVLADVAGAIAGAILWTVWYKKIDPCRNRGRNQN